MHLMTARSERIFHYALRTTDVEAARSFYAAVLGRSDLEIFQLHEQALARGARPHWLGFLDAGDVDAALSAFVARGAQQLGPKWERAGLEAAVVRDPGGAVVALAKPAPASATDAPKPDIVWHQLNTTDVSRAKANYSELFGLCFTEPVELGALGTFHLFSWQAGGAIVGALSDIAGRPGVHPHWLFHFRVAALEPAVEAVRAGGGLVLPLVVLPNGDRVAVCDDPQGGAFALIEHAAR
jgi:predicted enzyme related to lactoylglutathione lyase